VVWARNINLKCAFLNAENLFLLFDHPPQPPLHQYDEKTWQKLSTSVFENKPLKKSFELARAILEINPDILMLCEVGGLESLKNFNEYFLNSTYSPILIEGNSDRNIDVGFLIRKNLPFYYNLLSNKTRLINYLYPHERQSQQAGFALKVSSHKFSRDCAELRFFEKDQDKPFFIILLTHLKSRLDPDRIDPGGAERRAAEFKAVLEIYNELLTQFPEVPVAVCGDFNGNASRHGTDEEFASLYQNSDLEDILESAQTPLEERATFYQVRNGGRSEGRQIDFCFLNEKLRPFCDSKKSFVYRYKDEFGFAYEAPTTLESKMRLPSDHYPLVFELTQLPYW